ncbi:hypothetical protein [Saccharopolyspora gloriosae]|uniref:hypothetical protein n=1 Tax=Saccharopolyspora gloriosae TaxID=455344 RepID=UPI001FB678E8|nr:hypothetical protein [Saccharopolyspora gloriosae]
MDSPLIWIASVAESEWHAAARWEWNGARPVAVCGHVVPGKVHGRRSVLPPAGAGRSWCAACRAALEVEHGHLSSHHIPTLEPDTTAVIEPLSREAETARNVELTQALRLDPSWPSTDLDALSQVRRTQWEPRLAA